MATNPYTYGSFGARWTVGEPTSKSLLDISRLKNDANRWVLEQLLTDPDDTTGFGLLNGVTATTQSPSDNSTKIATTAYADAAASGASTPPGGSNTQVQYNDNGAFGASSNLTFDGTDFAVGNGAPSSYIDSVHGLIVGDTGDATSEIVIANSTTGVGEINFTDTADTTNQGQILYDHTSNFMSFDTAATEAMRIDTNGTVFINDTANAGMTKGLTISMGAHSNLIFALKADDVAHGMTNLAETDTYGLMAKRSGTLGGLYFEGLSEGAEAMFISGRATTEDTTDTSSSQSVIRIAASKANGVTAQAISASGNLMDVNNNGTTRMLIKGNGDMHITNTTLTALDTEDDIALIRAAQTSMSQGVGMAMDEWDEHLKASEDDLKRVGVLSSQGDFIIQQRYNSLVGGAIVQTYKKMMELARRIEDNVPALRGQLIPALGE